MKNAIEYLKQGLYQTFILDDNYLYFVRGLKVTLIVTVAALLIGIVLGVLVAVIRSNYDLQRGKKSFVMKVLNAVAKVYLTVIRGTPVMVQLLIMWFVVLASMRQSNQNMIFCAILTFGINSGAYVAEIFRSGIMSVDPGQMEAGRSLGLSYGTTMRKIVIPQAFKNVLPALGNEFIALIKETSIVNVIGLKDLTKGAMIIQGKTYQALVPYFALALFYLALVLILTWLLGIMERRLRASDLR